MDQTGTETIKENNQDFIDIDEVIKKKSTTLYRLTPGFLIRYLKRIVHQDEVNQVLELYQDKMGLDFIESLLTEKFPAEIEVKNPEYIPEKGRYIIASNHPLGGFDGLALMHVVGKKRKDIKFIVNDILLELKNLKDLFVPVNKHGRNTQESVKLIDSLYKSDQLVLVFPAGLVSRRQSGRIEDLEWKKSFISKAIKYQRDIIPVHMQGRNSDFFYNFALIRKKLGIKFNIEMLYLPDEMFRQREKKIVITFGKPIPYTTFTKEKTHHEWAQEVKSHVYSLPQGNLEFKV